MELIATKNNPSNTQFFIPIFLVITSLKIIVTIVAMDERVIKNPAFVIDMSNVSCINTRLPEIILLPATNKAIESIAAFFIKSFLKLIPHFTK